MATLRSPTDTASPDNEHEPMSGAGRDSEPSPEGPSNPTDPAELPVLPAYGAAATEEDEINVLREMYGDPDEDGIYNRGEER